MKFTHLHVHSHYSLLDGLAKIDQLIKRAKELNMDSLALTDHGVLYGAIEFYKKAKEAGIKPIIGAELYIALEGRHFKRPNIDKKRWHIVILAKNKTGYLNLIQLITRSHLEGFYYKPRVDKELLREHSEGLIAMSACLHGEVSRAISAGDIKKAEKVALEYQDIFGQGNFYLELMPHYNFEEQVKANKALKEISKKTNIPLVATNDVHYINPDDAEAQEVLMCIQTNHTIGDPDRLTMDDDFSLKSQEEMIKSFKDVPEAIKNTQKIAEQCNLEIKLDKIELPHFPLPKGKTADGYLNKLCLDGLKKRYKKVSQEIKNRLSHELGVIKKTGFAPYFLIVQDFVNWAKNQGIVVGPGRGSAGGSLVAYLLNITNIDPLKYNLLFERFLNPERISMPDIDLDFADTRRDEVIDYVASKYGQDKVAQIITFGTMAARAVVRDVGRALDYTYTFCDQLAKMIPFSWTLGEALKKVPELKESYETDEQTRRLIDLAKKLEGVARHFSTHACGVVITKNKIDNYTPRQRTSRDDEIIVTQYEMHAIEDLGLLKIDFLGLKNLTIIENTINLVKKLRNKEINIDKIPLNDKKVFELFQKANTTGVFQLESSGMRRYLQLLKPTEFEDIIAMVSLFRPGPMEIIPEFIARKHGRKEITYIHPKLEPILKNTYGVIVYQEQVIQIAKDLAGFSSSEADVLRKAVGKKIKKLLDEQSEKMIQGMVKNKIEKRTAQRIWEFFEPFARYGFNRCLTGDTEIVNYKTGDIITIQELYKNHKNASSVLTCQENLKLNSGEIIKVMSNGVKPVYEITTRLGKKIRATSNHPFLTFSGWRLLGKLKEGDRIAVPRFISTDPKNKLNIKNHQLIVLGYALAEGNFCHPHSFYFYSQSREELKDYIQALNKFKNTKATLNTSKKATSVYAGRKNLKEKSEAVEWIKKLGLQWKGATQKEIPDFVFRLNKKQLALLLGKMFQGDGCINLKRKDPQIFYSTSSKKLARQLQHLFLRLGIVSSLHFKKFKYRGGIKPGWTLAVYRYSNIQKFAEVFDPYFVGDKKRVLSQIIKSHPIIDGRIKSHAARGSKDTIPCEIIDLIREEIKKQGLSFKALGKRLGISNRLFNKDKRKKGFLRETVKIIGRGLNSPEILKYAHSDVYWDEIKSIKYFNKEQTFDLTIKDTHNFVANDIIVHNSHATCYAMIGYQTAYLKAYYTPEFMTALMNAEQNDIEEIAKLVSEAKKEGIDVLPPDINESFEGFTLVGPSIRFGLAAIKNVGHNVVEAIVEERKKNGPYKSIDDFLNRVESKDLNKKSLESLIKTGTFDGIGERGQLLANLEGMLNYSREIKKAKSNGQTNLFDSISSKSSNLFSLKTREASEYRESDRVIWEKELLGIYVSEHPLDRHQSFLEENTNISTIKSLGQGRAGKRVQIAGIINTIKKFITKTGKPMLFVELEDLTGKIETLVFPTVLDQNPVVWQEGKIVILSGRLSDKDDQLKILCDKAEELIDEN